MERGIIDHAINAIGWSSFGIVNRLVNFAISSYMFSNLDQNGLDYDNHSQLKFLLGFLQVLFVVPKACGRQG